MTPNRQCLEVWGELACFTRPELKVERFSYPIITPSAARGIFDAVYWKPKFRWQVVEIEVLTEPRYIALRRNEVKEKAALDTVVKWAEGSEEPKPIFADADEAYSGSAAKGRTQRQTMALKNVHYRLHAEIRSWPEYVSELPAMEAQFQRRAKAGQCINQPSFGCREFPAYFRLDERSDNDRYHLDQRIGWMLYDVFDLSRPGTPYSPPFISLFEASVQSGRLIVPDYDSPLVRKPVMGGDDA